MKPRALLLAIGVAMGASVPLNAVSAEDLEQKVERLESELQKVREELKAQPSDKPSAPPRPVTAEAEKDKQDTPFYRELMERVKLGAYGSMRFEHNSLDDIHNTFTLRRLVMTTDANIAPRLRAYTELEFERFRKLEVEKKFSGSQDGLEVEQAVEATDSSEISLEQVWLQYDLYRWLRLRAGGVLIPVGRFNINHDDNRWDLPRRSLIDRGVSVLPSKSAWDELGVGFNGDFDITDSVLGSYQFYVVNGVSLDAEIENIAESRNGDTTLIETEVEVSPSTGTFNLDNKDGKAVTGRLAISPTLGSEIATSFYWGRYTPDFLPNESLYSIAIDGIYNWGPVALEAEYIFTHFGGITDVARGFAERAINPESALENEQLESEVEFELANLARNKHGYWLELRYSFWPKFLNQTILGSPFDDPRLVAVFRPEQVWFDDLVEEIGFLNSTLTGIERKNTHVNRLTWGIAYRPVPLVAFQLAFEWTFAEDGTSLSEVTNYLPAKENEDDCKAALVGVTFGF